VTDILHVQIISPGALARTSAHRFPGLTPSGAALR
jgi:hypothetical protein